MSEIYYQPSDRLGSEPEKVETPKQTPAPSSPPANAINYVALFLSLVALGFAIFWNPRAISCATMQDKPIFVQFKGEGGQININEDIPISMDGEILVPIVFEIPNGTELMAYDLNGSYVVFKTAAPTYVKANVSIPASALFKNRTVKLMYNHNLTFVGVINTTVGEVFGDLCSLVS